MTVAGVVHIVGTVVDVGSRTRQCCAWCGTVLLDGDAALGAAEAGHDPRPPHFPPGVLLLVDGNMSVVVEHEDGDQLPANACVDLTPADRARAELAQVLEQIKRDDIDDEIRYVLVWQALSLALATGYDANARLDSDALNRPMVCINLPTGQVSWHIPRNPIRWGRLDTDEKHRFVQEFVATAKDHALILGRGAQ